MWRASIEELRKATYLILCLIPLSVSPADAENAVFTLHRICPTSTQVLFSSPVLIDLDGNPHTLEIVVGDESGNIYAFDCLGRSLWVFSIRRFPGFDWVQTACQCAPAIADLDGDGALEVAVSLASRDEFVASKPGAVFMFRLDSNGLNPTIQGGFCRPTYDRNGDRVADGAYASPTVADLDGDGKLEIVAGVWDQLCYALRFDGTLFWNLNNDLADPFEFGFKTGDTIWTTPAIVDIDSDRAPEVIFGVDAHHFPWGHQIPYQMNSGGLLVVLEGRTGTLEVGPGKFFHESYHEEGYDYYYNPMGENHVPVCNISEVFQSSPVVADVDADGRYEIVHGTGQRYYKPNDDKHARIFCWNAENAIAQWASYAGAEVYASVAVANVDSDPELEIFARNFDERNPMLYGFNGASGSPVPGFPTPVHAGNPRSIGAVIGDVDGDGGMEIITVSFGRLHVFGPNGVEESGFSNCPNLMYTSPAIGDIDSDGHCELIVTSAEGIRIYRCNNGPVGPIPWGQYRRDARNSGVVPHFDAEPVSLEVVGDVIGGDLATVRVKYYNVGSTVWTRENVRLVTRTPGVYEPPYLLPYGTAVANGQALELVFATNVPKQLGPSTLRFQLTQMDGTPIARSFETGVVIGELRSGVPRWTHYR